MRPRVIAYIIGGMIFATGAGMALPFLYALYHADAGTYPLLITMLAMLGGGAAALRVFRWRFSRDPNLDAREGVTAVAGGWLATGLLGGLPYRLGGMFDSFTDAAFESFSGFSTTGSSVLADIEAAPASLLLWRGMTHWLGGMGIIVLSLAILPHLGVGGLQLFRAEVPGPNSDRLTPRLKDTAIILWQVYLFLTIAMFLLLLLGEMDFVEAATHSFATLATGGFSTRNASLAAFSPYSQWVCVVFMFMAGVNFTIHFNLLRGKFRLSLADEEFRLYACIGGAAALIISFQLLSGGMNLEPALRTASFQAVSIMTTTGFVTADYEIWPPLAQTILLILMLIGGSAGSTAGGIKCLRVLVLGKVLHREVFRLAHPNSVRPTKLNQVELPKNVIDGCVGFVALFFLVWAASALALAAIGLDLATSLSASLTCLANVGPGFGGVGPAENFQWLPDPAKWILSLDMLLGRLELFTLLVLCSRTFWRR